MLVPLLVHDVFFLSVTVTISVIPLNFTPNYLTNHFTGPMVSKVLEILKAVKHRKEPSFGTHTVY